MSSKITDKLTSLSSWQLLLVGVLASEVLTLFFSTLFSFMLWGHISYEIIVIGTLDAFIVALIIVFFTIIIVKRIRITEITNKQLREEIEERKRAEAENKRLADRLNQAMKMESIGTLAGGIAHDFNNILSAILGYTDLVLADLPADSQAANDLQKVMQAGNRATDLVKQILAFSRRSDQELKPIRIQLIIKEALKLLRSTIPTTIAIKQNINKDCGAVLADPSQIHQIIMNLCTNAYQAMRETGGTLSISLESVDLEPGDLNSTIHLQPGPYVVLRVSDTGCGITTENMGKIFEPYFTTKTTSEGTGLGLATVHGIVLGSGGDITIDSEPGKGSVFHIYLPTIGKRKEVVQDKDSAPLPTGKERIIIVDDDENITQMNKKILESLGYRVTSLTSSIDTLAAFKKDPNAFDLVLTDMTMPEMTGARLSEKILAIRPDIPIILCTGFSELMNDKKAKEIGIRKFVVKPFIKKDMARVVRKVLDG